MMQRINTDEDRLFRGDLKMQPNVIDLWTNMGENAFNAAKQLGEINMRASEKLLQQQLDLTTAWVDAGSRNLELMSKAKGLPELLSSQAKLAQECSQQWIDGYRQANDILSEARQAVTELVDENMKTAQQNVKQAVAEKKAS